jgi:hypothetical protein
MGPFLPWKLTGMRKGAGWLPGVIGATITVLKWLCISGSEITTARAEHKRVANCRVFHMSPGTDIADDRGCSTLRRIISKPKMVQALNPDPGPEGEPVASAISPHSHCFSFDHRRAAREFLTAIANAFLCPTSTTRRLPRVIPV